MKWSGAILAALFLAAPLAYGEAQTATPQLASTLEQGVARADALQLRWELQRIVFGTAHPHGRTQARLLFTNRDERPLPRQAGPYTSTAWTGSRPVRWQAAW